MMATQPKPKPKPEPDPPEPEEGNAARAPIALDTREGRQDMMARMDAGLPGADSLERLHERLDALFTSQTALIDRVEKLEERVAAPPIGLGRRP
jgi:hypothetical protein